MSAWEGSALQEATEQRKKEIARIEDRVRRENPSLSWDGVRKVAAKIYDDQHPTPKPRCCPCTSAERAEWIDGVTCRCMDRPKCGHAQGDPGVCGCGCHRAKVSP